MAKKKTKKDSVLEEICGAACGVAPVQAIAAYERFEMQMADGSQLTWDQDVRIDAGVLILVEKTKDGSTRVAKAFAPHAWTSVAAYGSETIVG